MENLYREYSNFIEKVLVSGDISYFKNHPSYTYMLEHVSAEQGQQYLDIIRRHFRISDEDISSFCRKNDSLGSPKKASYGNLTVSPSSLRYILHALLILQQCEACGQKTPSIVELGGGYGGLALAVDYFSPRFGVTVTAYTMIDLKNPGALQKAYISNHTLRFPVAFINGEKYGEEITGTDNFLVSAYCFSEISSDHQKNYLKTLFPKCSHGFIVWNHIPIYDIGKVIRSEIEYPLTGGLNHYVYF
jgi:hypothetical protein